MKIEDAIHQLRDEMKQMKHLSIEHIHLLTAAYGLKSIAASRPADVLAQKQQLLSGTSVNRRVMDIVSAINELAMANTDVIHVFTSFSGHVNEFSAHAHSADVAYEEDVPLHRLINARVYLHKEDALEKLLSIESQLTELVIEAREQAEVAECNTQQ